jgi:uncharacterized protein (DUF4415 family)
METEKQKGGRPRKLISTDIANLGANPFAVKRKPGRPVAEPKYILRIRMTIPDYEKIRELGGDKWARRVVNEALAAALAAKV